MREIKNKTRKESQNPTRRYITLHHPHVPFYATEINNPPSKIDSIVEQILFKFQNIIEVLTNNAKPKELLSVESLTIESDAIQIIRYCQDLLSILRSLKESWVLGSLKVKGQVQDQDQEKEQKLVLVLGLGLVLELGSDGEGNVADTEFGGSSTSLVSNRNEREADKVFKLFNELTDTIATLERPKPQT